MADADTEARLRRALARYAEAREVDRPPVADVVDRAESPSDGDTSRPQRFVLVAACAALLAGTAVVVWPDGEPRQVSTGPESERSAGGSCGSRSEADDGVDEAGAAVGSGVLPDGREWEARLSGWPPVPALSVVIGGEPAVGATWDEPEWSTAVNDGSLTWDLGVYGGGQFVVGVTPASAERVDVQTPDGDVAHLCPVAVPAFGAVKFVAAQVALEPGTVDIAVLDGAGRRVAQGRATVPSPQTPEGSRRQQAIGSGGQARLPLLVEVDPAAVDLPLGGGETSQDELVRPLATGDAPGGQWALETRRAGAGSSPVLLRMRGPELSSIDRLDLAAAGTGSRGSPLAWHVGRSVDGRYLLDETLPPDVVGTLVWGLVPADVSSVVVSFGDGGTVDVPTVSLRVDGTQGRAFATHLPGDRPVTGMEGRAADGTVRLRATGVDHVDMFDAEVPASGGGLAALDALAPRTDALLTVEPVD
jgi:hypothetical protein